MGKSLHIVALLHFVFSGFVGLSQNLVISEVYGGGGNSGATYKNDFIELYNPTATSISLTGWSVQYTSASGTSWQVTNLTGSITAGSFYLIQEAVGSGGTMNLPTPDAIGTINLSGTNGKVALVSSTSALTGSCPLSVIDVVGYGSSNCYEGSATTPALTNTISATRKITCVDTNNNASDFKSASPNPQNSTAPSLSPLGFTSDYPKVQLITSTGLQVVTNLAGIGTTYFVILPSGATAPASIQVKNGQDGNGTPLMSGFQGAIQVTSPSTEFTAIVTNLDSSAPYDVYFVTEQCVLSSPTLVQALTLPAPDITPPDYQSGYPKVQDITSTGFQISSSLDEVGITYFVVLMDGTATPSATQVKAGQDGNGTALSLNQQGQLSVTSANTQYESVMTGLSSSTRYNIYFISEDLALNLQASVVRLDLTTLTPPPFFVENFNSCEGTSSLTKFSVNGEQEWGCTDFGRGSSGIRMNGYSDRAEVNEDWLIAPVVTLGANASLSFYSQFSFAGNPLQLKISSDFTGEGDPTKATWTDLNGNFPTMPVASTSTDASDWTLSSVDLSPYASQKIYVAFVYVSTSTAAARWTLDDITFNNAVASYLQIAPSTLMFNTTGSIKNYTIKGFNLTNDVTVTTSANFTISKDNITFSNSISYTSTEVNNAQPVYVQFTAAMGEIDISTKVISNTSTGVATKNVAVEGTDKSQTLDIATYNLEFFGADVVGAGGEFGPVDDPLQINNVTSVMQTIGADIYGVEEISNDDAFSILVSNLTGYDKIVSDRWSYSFNGPDPNYPPQKIGFIFNTSTVQVVSSRVMFAQMYDSVRAGNISLLPGYPTTDGSTPSNFWSSGRLPFMVTFDVIINGFKKRIRVIDIHAKSGSAPADYDRRKYDVMVLYDSLLANYAHDNIVLLGDFNDDVEASINSGSESPYKVFVDNTSSFNVLTDSISQTGVFTFPSDNSFLDHIISSNELTNAYVNNSISIEDPRAYIPNYAGTTSDHLPVSARFLLFVKTAQTISFSKLANKTFGDTVFTLSASSTSGLSVSFSSSDSTIASVSGNIVTILKAGIVNITASQMGDASYDEATDVIQSLTINKATQTIAFDALPNKTLGDTAFIISATSSSGLPVSFNSSDTTILMIAGDTVTLRGAGAITISANQVGNVSYQAASSVSQRFCINPAKPTVALAGTNMAILTSSASSGNEWFLNGLAIIGATNSTIEASVDGAYSVQVKVDNCLSAPSDNFSIIITGDIPTAKGFVLLYPNPSPDFFFITGINDKETESILIDMAGKYSPIKLEQYGDMLIGNVNTLTNGMYILKIREGNTTHQIKLVKQ